MNDSFTVFEAKTDQKLFDYFRAHGFAVLRTCLKSTFCKVRTAHRSLKAPEGRKVYRNAQSPVHQAPEGRQVRDGRQ